MKDVADARVDHAPGATVHALVERWARAEPGRLAVEADSHTLTYGELNRRADEVARRLRDAGVNVGAVVGIAVGRSVDLVVGLLGILKAGAAYLPLELDNSPERLVFMMEETEVSVVVTQSGLVNGLPSRAVSLVLLDELGAGDNYSEPDQLSQAGMHDLAYVMYTSGSTGTPKAVLVNHAGVVNLVTDQSYVEISPGDRIAALSTIAFDASTFEIWAPVVNGATCVVQTFGGKDIPGLVQWLRRTEISILHVTSPVFRLLNSDELRGLDRLHTILFGGDRVRSEIAAGARRSFSGRMVHLYGPTETTGFATSYNLHHAQTAELHVPIGRPIRGVRAYVLGPDGVPLSEDGEGELGIAGLGVARGYLRRDDLTAERFVADPGDELGRMYHTGDRVRRDGDGVLHFLGRNDRQVKVRGYRVEPAEVEVALTRHAAIRDAIVLARADSAGDTRLDAYVVPADAAADHGALVVDVRRYLSTALPPYLRPASVTAITAFPLTDNLKVDEARLPVPGDARSVPGAAVPPSTELEMLLAEVWCASLGLAEVGVTDHFFELGGDSLSAVRMAAAVGAVCGHDVDVVDVFRNPTIRQLGEMLAGKQG